MPLVRILVAFDFDVEDDHKAGALTRAYTQLHAGLKAVEGELQWESMNEWWLNGDLVSPARADIARDTYFKMTREQRTDIANG